MYHCDLRFYLAGTDCLVFQRIRAAAPLPNFTHAFVSEVSPLAASAAQADAIFLNLEGLELQPALEAVTKGKGEDAQLIVLASQAQIPGLAPYYDRIYDVWTLPMGEGEADFRLRRWLTACKLRRDHWEINQYLETTINSIPNMIWYKTKDGIHEKVNNGFCAVVGKTKEQAEGRDHCYIWDASPEDAQVCAETDQKVMDARATVTAEESVLSGTEQLLLTTYKSPLYDLDGSVMGTVGIGIDITKERAYRDELVHKNHTMETIFASLDCGVILHSIDGTRILNINEAALNILGYESLEELMASGFHMVAQSVLDEDKPKLAACIQSLQKEGDSTDVEYRVLHKNGELLHVLGNIKLIRENGVDYYQRFLLDVTTQRLQEQQALRRQQELVQALGNDYSIICSFDLKTGLGYPIRMELSQETAQRLDFHKDMTLAESMERYIQEQVHEGDQEMMRQALSRDNLIQKLTQQQVFYMDFRALEGEEVRYYEVKAVRTGTWETNQNMVLGFRSVDEAIRAEMEQRQLMEEALIQANRANKAKTSFLSNMSHDIRTPMNAIVGFTALAINHLAETEKVREYLDKIQGSSEHLLRLLNDILDMSQIESGKVQLSEIPCNLPQLAGQLRDLVHVSACNKELDFQMDLTGIVHPDVFCDKLRLDQVLLNVITNAIRYTPAKGSVTLRVAETLDAPAGYGNYVFSVKDTGIGMSPEFLQRVFEPFERERTTTTSGIQGTGLGMAITKNIVDMMNGTIQVDSTQGQGTTVTISLSFRLGETAEAAAPAGGQRAPVVLAHDGRILLVEDNPLNQEIAATILEDAGFEVDTADNGQLALDALKAAEPGYYKLILMDIQMPVMDGYQATRAIRALPDPSLASIPILAMTANAFEEDKQQALRCGMNGHIAKPIDVDMLLETLGGMMGR